MYPVSQAYITAISAGAPQHIRGSLILAAGGTVQLTEEGGSENYIVGSPQTDCRCTESEDSFMPGEMYVGTVGLTVRLSGSSGASRFRGAQLTLEFGVDVGDTDPEWVPLGLWDITSAEKLIAPDQWKLKGADRLNRLRAAINDSTVGRIRLATVMQKVAYVSNVVFAQTVDEIAALIGRPASRITCVEFSSTCWEEVRQIAQLMGGFAFANREGKIEFRKFGMSPVRDIPADLRFSLRQSEITFGIASVTYTDSKGHSYTAESADASGTVDIGFACNKYIYTGSDDYADYFADWIDPIAAGFSQSWYSGSVDYYGDPAIDLGDMISVTGGIPGTSHLPMLITGISWTFRAPQALTSAGLSDTGSSSSVTTGGSSSGGSSSQTSVAAQKVIALDTFSGEFSGRYTAAQGVFGARQSIDGAVNVGIVLLADTDGVASFTVELDGIAQVLSPTVSTHQGEYTTLYANVPISPEEGSHTVEVICRGSGTISDISAVVTGQDISPESPDITAESDYTYTVSNGAATVTGYVGSSTYPRIPDRLGGSPVKIIAQGAFTGTSVGNVYIPEGVEEIQ